MIKYFISDLDGTLLFRNVGIKQSDIKALNKSIQEGLHLWVATGRGYDAYDMLKRYDIYPEQMVCSSGAVLCDKENHVRYLSVISNEDAKHLFTFLEENYPELDYTLDLDSHEYHFARLDSGNLLRHLPDFPQNIAINVSEFLNHPELKLMRLFCVSHSNEYCAEVRKAIEVEFGGRLKALKTDTNCLDIIPSECGKWHGVSTLLKENHIDPKEVAAIGDEETDVEMIRNCGIGLAMYTADESVRNAADYVVKSVEEALNIIKSK